MNSCNEYGSSRFSSAQRWRSFWATSSETSRTQPSETLKPNANWVAVLAVQQIVDNSFKIGVFEVRLAPGTTHSTEVVEDQKDIPVDAETIDGRTHHPTPRSRK
jgi:hypothetical protein